MRLFLLYSTSFLLTLVTSEPRTFIYYDVHTVISIKIYKCWINWLFYYIVNFTIY